jgi:polysaccharide export outer membrane protein
MTNQARPNRLFGMEVSQKGTSVITSRQFVASISALAFLCQSAGAAAQQPLPAPSSPAGTTAPYRINPGDELEILVWGDERLQRSVLVLPDGTFGFPLVGQVSAAGRLPSDLQRAITTGLQPQYRGQVPQVTVSVKRAAGYQFSVVGKVRSPGTFTPGRYVNALEALAIAGGPSEFANMSSARVIRKAGDRLFVVPVRIQDALRGDTARLGPNDIPRIESGDTLVIP